MSGIGRVQHPIVDTSGQSVPLRAVRAHYEWSHSECSGKHNFTQCFLSAGESWSSGHFNL